jgi:ABC-type polar amino acid transport system ATPase subunit
VIRVENLVKEFGGARILRGISFELAEQKILGVIGASGSGKSTLLRCLNGLERIDGGVVECDGVRLQADLTKAEYQRRVRALRRKVGTVFQHLHLFPHLSALGNVAEAPVQVLHTPRNEALKRAQELLEAVGLAQASDRYPDSLSGGEQQRVAIARALANSPRVLLADEPTGNLDSTRAAELLALLREMVERERFTVLLVTHDRELAARFADRTIQMKDGKVVMMNAE